MRSFLEVLRFELRLQLTSPMFAGLCLLFFALHLLTISQAGIHLSDNQLMAYNSAYLIFRTELVLGVFGMVPAIIFVVNAAARDTALETSEFFQTTPVPRLSFLLGRYSGALLCTLFTGLAGLLGTLAGTFMPWLEPDRIARLVLDPYLQVFVLIVVPNLVVFSAFAFCLAVLSRGPAWSFAMALGFVLLAVVLNTSSAFQSGAPWLSMLDPFGAIPVEREARFWTVSELNTDLPTALLPANRALWLALAAAALAATSLTFRLEQAPSRNTGFKRPRRTAAQT